ncbi:MAG: SPFH domain-containing protein, partial [Planctomycetota bacterium]
MARSSLFKRTHSNFRGPQIRFRWSWVRWIIILILLIVAPFTAIYTVSTDSVGIVKRFGKYKRTTQPGIHLKIPYWIETATSVPVKKIQKQEFGFRTLKAGVDSQYLGVDELQGRRIGKDGLKELIRESGESTWGLADSQLAKRAGEILTGEYIMLTGDLNIADVEWIVQYKIK